MNCHECTDFLMDYLDGNLPAEELVVFEQHLQRCPPCVVYLETYRRCIQMGKICVEQTEATICTDAPEGLVKAILAARKDTGS